MTWKLAFAALLPTLAGCGLVRDCSLEARLERHAAERERLRDKLRVLSPMNLCQVERPRALQPEEQRLSIVRGRIRWRIAASELRGDLEQVDREQQAIRNNAIVDCVGPHEWSEEEVREGRAAQAAELRLLREVDAEFQSLAARIEDC